MKVIFYLVLDLLSGIFILKIPPFLRFENNPLLFLTIDLSIKVEFIIY
jgi:hypothetical protein